MPINKEPMQRTMRGMLQMTMALVAQLPEELGTKRYPVVKGTADEIIVLAIYRTAAGNC